MTQATVQFVQVHFETVGYLEQRCRLVADILMP